MTPDRLWLAWHADPIVVFSLVGLGWMYARGARALWRVAGPERGVRTWQAAAFGVGLGVVGVALVSPLDALADVLFSAHMVQHLLLVTVAAPLIGVGAPVLPLIWAWRRSARVAVARALGRAHPLLKATLILSSLPVAFAVHSLALWVWHTPGLYEGALRNAAVHASEHLVLLGTGVLVWSAACSGLARTGRAAGASALYVAGLGVQCMALGALITFAPQPWYAFYAGTSGAWGLSAMDDQVLAGVLMWVPAGLVYLTLALVLLGAWLRPLPP